MQSGSAAECVYKEISPVTLPLAASAVTREGLSTWPGKAAKWQGKLRPFYANVLRFIFIRFKSFNNL